MSTEHKPHSVHWLRVQLDGILEDAEAHFRTIGSGSEASAEGRWSAAFLGNLRDARAGVDGIEEQLEAAQKALREIDDMFPDEGYRNGWTREMQRIAREALGTQ